VLVGKEAGNYHLVRNVQHSFQVEFAPALLEQVFQRLAQQIHHHHVVHLTVVGFLVADEVQEGHEGLATHLVDEFGLPEEHNVSLHFNCFFLNSKKSVTNNVIQKICSVPAD